MSLQKPYGLFPNGQTIDATDINEFSWKVSGDISIAFELFIYNNATGNIVFSTPKITSYATKYSLPANTLSNGIEYKWQVKVYNQANESSTSEFVVFQSSSRPHVTVDSFGTIANRDYVFTATYSQSESVGMRSWIAYLYSENQSVILTSGVSTSPILFFPVSNLESGKNYYVEFQVTSYKGLTGTTGKLLVSVLYEKPEISLNLTAKNIKKAGVELNWYVISIIGRVEGTTFFIGGEKLDVHNGKVIFDDGFQVLDGNFSLKLWIEEPEHKIDLLEIKCPSGRIYLQYSLIDECFYLYKGINGLSYVGKWVSETVNSGRYCIEIKQIDGEMDLQAVDWI